MICIRISAAAFLKMQALVAGYEHEVGWYGTAEKINNNTYKIMDILVYPQYADSAYIDDKDTTEMPQWFASLSDDVFERKRFHGHSHVNMGVHSSSRDDETYRQFKTQNAQALKNRFTIELIINKRFEMNWKIHDAESDKEYTNKDINVEIEISENQTMAEFYDESRKNVRELKECKDFLLQGKPSKVKEKESPTSKSTKLVDKEKVKFLVNIYDDDITIKKVSTLLEDDRVIYDLYGTAYKIINNSTAELNFGTVADSLLRLLECRDDLKFDKCDCFAIFKIKTGEFLNVNDPDTAVNILDTVVISDEIVEYDDMNVVVICI